MAIISRRDFAFVIMAQFVVIRDEKAIGRNTVINTPSDFYSNFLKSDLIGSKNHVHILRNNANIIVQFNVIDTVGSAGQNFGGDGLGVAAYAHKTA